MLCAWESAHHGVMDFLWLMGSDTTRWVFVVDVTRGLKRRKLLVRGRGKLVRPSFLYHHRILVDDNYPCGDHLINIFLFQKLIQNWKVLTLSPHWYGRPTATG